MWCWILASNCKASISFTALATSNSISACSGSIQNAEETKYDIITVLLHFTNTKNLLIFCTDFQFVCANIAERDQNYNLLQMPHYTTISKRPFTVSLKKELLLMTCHNCVKCNSLALRKCSIKIAPADKSRLMYKLHNNFE